MLSCNPIALIDLPSKGFPWSMSTLLQRLRNSSRLVARHLYPSFAPQVADYSTSFSTPPDLMPQSTKSADGFSHAQTHSQFSDTDSFAQPSHHRELKSFKVSFPPCTKKPSAFGINVAQRGAHRDLTSSMAISSQFLHLPNWLPLYKSLAANSKSSRPCHHTCTTFCVTR
jgi:hypothetical protein